MAVVSVGVIAIGIAAVSQVAMMRAIRKKMGDRFVCDDQLRVVQILYQSHRSLFPRSRLRKVHCATLLLILFSTVGFILALKSARQ